MITNFRSYEKHLHQESADSHFPASRAASHWIAQWNPPSCCGVADD